MYLPAETGISLLSIVISLLVGGFAGTLLTVLTGYFSERRERRMQFIDNQIIKLYGPLYYFTSQSEKLFELNKGFHSAYSKEYIEKKWSQERNTQKNLEKETSETLDIANKYIEQVEENNKQSKKALDENYSLIDPDDMEVFLLFYEHHVRLATEQDSNGRLKTPHRIYEQIGDISFLRPEVIGQVKNKFLSKKSELERLIKSNIVKRSLRKRRRLGNKR